MKVETIAIFGDPIPTAMLSLAWAVDRALDDAEQSTNAVQELKQRVKEIAAELSTAQSGRMDAEYLHPRNLGGHYYPHLGDGTADCDYCKCWMGSCSSGGDEGVDPFKDCPGNPKLRDAYKLLQEQAAKATAGRFKSGPTA